MIERTHAATHTLVTLDSKTDCIKARFEYELEKLETTTNESRRIRGYTQGGFGAVGGGSSGFVGYITIKEMSLPSCLQGCGVCGCSVYINIFRQLNINSASTIRYLNLN